MLLFTVLHLIEIRLMQVSLVLVYKVLCIRKGWLQTRQHCAKYPSMQIFNTWINLAPCCISPLSNPTVALINGSSRKISMHMQCSISTLFMMSEGRCIILECSGYIWTTIKKERSFLIQSSIRSVSTVWQSTYVKIWYTRTFNSDTRMYDKDGIHVNVKCEKRIDLVVLDESTLEPWLTSSIHSMT